MYIEVQVKLKGYPTSYMSPKKEYLNQCYCGNCTLFKLKNLTP